MFTKFKFCSNSTSQVQKIQKHILSCQPQKTFYRLKFHFKYTDYSVYHNTWTLWNTQAGICTIHGMVLINIFLITASDEGQYQPKYPIW